MRPEVVDDTFVMSEKSLAFIGNPRRAMLRSSRSVFPLRRSARPIPGGQDLFLAGKTYFWRARLIPGGQDLFLAGKTYS
jgi:hypothetical protein